MQRLDTIRLARPLPPALFMHRGGSPYHDGSATIEVVVLLSELSFWALIQVAFLLQI